MRTFGWITLCFLFGCSSTLTRDLQDAGNVSDAGGGFDGGGGSDGGCPSCDGGTACSGAGADGGPGSLIYCQSFAGHTGDDWPAPWQPIGGHISVHDIYNNQGRFRSDATGQYPLGRMVLPGFSEGDVDVSWTVAFEDPVNQGSGFYVRQNGQYVGEGYCLFLEGNLLEQDSKHLAFWYAVGGVEYRFYQPATPLPSPFSANVPYRMRFEVVQIDPNTTRLRGKVWPAGDTEPPWQIETTDSTPSLQNAKAGFAFDVFNSRGSTGNVFVSDLRIARPVP